MKGSFVWSAVMGTGRARALQMSAFGGKADMTIASQNVR